MKRKFIVLTDFSPAGARAQAYAAALAGPLGAVVHLVHVAAMMPITALEYGLSMPVMDRGYVREIHGLLNQAAARLPVPATSEVIENDWYPAIEQVLAAHRPVLLIAGLTATTGRLDEWFSNRTLPLVHDTGYPLLLVPEHLPDTVLHPPHRLALAVRDEPFALTSQVLTLAPLLDILKATLVPVTVVPPDAAPIAGQRGWHAAQQCHLADKLDFSELHWVVAEEPAAGIVQAVKELSADMLALLDPGHGWVETLFGGSIIDEVLRHTPVPVLLLATRKMPRG